MDQEKADVTMNYKEISSKEGDFSHQDQNKRSNSRNTFHKLLSGIMHLFLRWVPPLFIGFITLIMYKFIF